MMFSTTKKNKFKDQRYSDESSVPKMLAL